MQVVVKTAPDTLPVTVALVMRHIRALADDIDLANLYAQAATQWVEEYTGRALVQTVYTAQLQAWPCFAPNCGINGPPERANKPLQTIVLPRSPLVAIVSVKYFPNDGGAQQTWDVANYRTDVRALPGRLVFIDGVTFPALAVRADAVEIEFTAGHGTLEHQMPPLLKVAMLQLARHFFDNPGLMSSNKEERQLPFGVRNILRSQRV